MISSVIYATLPLLTTCAITEPQFVQIIPLVERSHLQTEQVQPLEHFFHSPHEIVGFVYPKCFIYAPNTSTMIFATHTRDVNRMYAVIVYFMALSIL